MKIITGFVISLAALFFSLIVAEVAIRKIASAENTDLHGVNNLASKEIFARYTAEEKDSSLPLFTAAQGGEVVTIKNNGTAWYAKGDWYHPYYGYRTIYVDQGHAKEHLHSGELSVVFIGGSTMGNLYTPNHLTTIDSAFHNAMKGFREVHSLNVAEVGARSTNELIRFMLEVIPLQPEVVVFLDGYNEFTPLGYGKDAESNYHWITVDARVNAPLYFLRDRFIEKSALLTTALWKTGFLESSQRTTKKIEHQDILRAANRYIENTKFIHQLCEANNITCLSFLQPTVLTKEHVSKNEQISIENWLLHQPQFKEILQIGYDHILKNSPDTIDLSNSIGGTTETIYFDWPHVGKTGNARIGAAMAAAVKQTLSRR